jgi:caa(3)-type oxidase subunit IV
MFAVSISPPLGAWNTFIGIAIAFLKAGLVAMLFMELSRSRTLIRLAGA